MMTILFSAFVYRSTSTMIFSLITQEGTEVSKVISKYELLGKLLFKLEKVFK